MNEVQMAAKFYDARDTMRRFWGEKYEAELAFYRTHLEARMKRDSCDTLTAAMTIMQELQAKFPDSGFEQAMFLAATVEMIEPERSEEL